MSGCRSAGCMPTRSLDCAPMPGSTHAPASSIVARRAGSACRGSAWPVHDPASIAEAVHDLWMVQLDPTRVVARTEHLVLFSRLGRRFRIEELERMLWRRPLALRVLGAHRADGRLRRPPGVDAAVSLAGGRTRRSASRRYVGELAARRTRRSADTCCASCAGAGPSAPATWRTGPSSPWRSRRLERRGRAKRLDDARHPLEPGRGDDRRARRPAAALGSRRAEPAGARATPCRSARSPAPSWSGSCAPADWRSRQQFGWAFDGRPPGWERALSELVREGVAVPAAVEGSARDGSRTPRCSSAHGSRAPCCSRPSTTS